MPTKSLPRAIHIEALRLARLEIKAEIKKLGHKISFYRAEDITTMANELVAADKSFIRKAKYNVKHFPRPRP